MLRNLATLGLSAIAIAAASSGALASGDESQTINFGPFTTSTVYNLDFAKFTPSLGTLTAVTETLTVNGTVQGFLYDVFNQNGGLSYSNFNVTSSSTATLFGSVVTTNNAVTIGPYAGTTVAGDTYVPETPVSVSNSSFSTITSNLTGFIGPGTAHGGLSVSAGYMSAPADGPSGLSYGGLENLNGSVVIDYTYTPAVHTPEPGSVALLLAGGTVTFAGLRRRRSLRK